jgi:signal peptidase I
MSPNINDNDILYVQPVQFERGEIVVAKCPNTDEYVSASNVALLKRIVGLPGETVEIVADGVLINGSLIDEPYTVNQDKSLQESNDVNEIILSDNEYFLLGDNRENSFDSRHVGQVPASNFLYGLTTEPNEHTYNIFRNVSIVASINILLLITLPILMLMLFTHRINKNLVKTNRRVEPNKKNHTDENKHQTQIASNRIVRPQPKSKKNKKREARIIKAKKDLETSELRKNNKKR